MAKIGQQPLLRIEHQEEKGMWIHHIGEIAIGLFVLLFAAHFGLHFLFKWQKHRRQTSKHKIESTEEK